MNKKQTIGFIGGGNMAQAMISGLLASGYPAQRIMVSDPNDDKRKAFCEQGLQATSDNSELIAFADTVILAIKPQIFASLLPQIAPSITDDKLIISVAAGVTIETIATLINHNNIIRVMPNTPALVQTGAAGLYAHTSVSKEDKNIAESIIASSGLAIWVDNEELIHSVTAVSGSAPAYFFYLMEAMIAKGEELGLSYEQAKNLTLQTALGSAKMALASTESPTILRQRVTSPNGTTHAAIENMKAHNFEAIISDALQACVDRSKEMAKG